MFLSHRNTALILTLATVLSFIPKVSFAQPFDCRSLGNLAQYDARCTASPNQSSSSKPKDSALPLPEDIGGLMAQAMCQELLSSSQKLSMEYASYFADSVMRRYGEKTTQQLFSQLENESSDFSKAYNLAMFRALFQTLINDNDCFPVFLKFSSGLTSELSGKTGQTRPPKIQK
jgi:hypothetical protein